MYYKWQLFLEKYLGQQRFFVLRNHERSICFRWCLFCFVLISLCMFGFFFPDTNTFGTPRDFSDERFLSTGYVPACVHIIFLVALLSGRIVYGVAPFAGWSRSWFFIIMSRNKSCSKFWLLQCVELFFSIKGIKFLKEAVKMLFSALV